RPGELEVSGAHAVPCPGCPALLQRTAKPGQVHARGAGVHGQEDQRGPRAVRSRDRKSTRLNSSHEWISYAVFCLKKKTTRTTKEQRPYPRREASRAEEKPGSPERRSAPETSIDAARKELPTAHQPRTHVQSQKHR